MVLPWVGDWFRWSVSVRNCAIIDCAAFAAAFVHHWFSHSAYYSSCNVFVWGVCFFRVSSFDNNFPNSDYFFWNMAGFSWAWVVDRFLAIIWFFFDDALYFMIFEATVVSSNVFVIAFWVLWIIVCFILMIFAVAFFWGADHELKDYYFIVKS